jgi:hypothetical protein
MGSVISPLLRDSSFPRENLPLMLKKEFVVILCCGIVKALQGQNKLRHPWMEPKGTVFNVHEP